MNTYNPKHNPAARRKMRNRDLPKPTNIVHEPIIGLSYVPRADRPKKEAWSPKPFDVLSHAKAATAQNEQNPSDSPGRRGLGGRLPGIPASRRQFLKGTNKLRDGKGRLIATT